MGVTPSETDSLERPKNGRRAGQGSRPTGPAGRQGFEGRGLINRLLGLVELYVCGEDMDGGLSSIEASGSSSHATSILLAARYCVAALQATVAAVTPASRASAITVNARYGGQ